MSKYLRRTAPIKEPMRLTKYDEPYCDIYPINEDEEVVNEQTQQFKATHTGQCARCGNFAPLAMAQYNTEDRGLVARLICKQCWNETQKGKSKMHADMAVINNSKKGVFS